MLKHVYTERRVTPLNLYLREAADEAAGRDAVLDYGQVIKDLAATNIFPGDMLLKNFGVTRHGRVVFYDYDEICLLTECNFRTLPEPRTEDEVMAAEPWFSSGPTTSSPRSFAPSWVSTGRCATSSSPRTATSSAPSSGARCRRCTPPGR